MAKSSWFAPLFNTKSQPVSQQPVSAPLGQGLQSVQFYTGKNKYVKAKHAGHYSPYVAPPTPPKPKPKPQPLPAGNGRVLNFGNSSPSYQTSSPLSYQTSAPIPQISGSYMNPSGVHVVTGIHRHFGSGYFHGSPNPHKNPTIPDDAVEVDSPVIPYYKEINPIMLSQFTVNGKNLMLKQSDYKAAGGEGVVYVKNGNAYKIYHDASKMIAVGKIQELSALTMPNILGPKDIIYHNNTPVGFVMRYVSDTEFLCKLFTKGFRDKMGVTPDQINHLVKGMQDTLHEIHNKNILVVDYNEMNFLVNRGFDTVYNIDVDSYQTPSYRATAIMESIRDRKVKSGKFTKESDWFSFATVAFQMYMGTHP